MVDRTRDHPPAEPRPPLGRWEFTRRVLIVLGLAAVAVAVAAVFARVYDIFLLIFLAVLLATLLRAVSDGVASRTGLNPGWSLAAVVALLAAAFAGGAYAVGSVAAEQLDQVVSGLPHSLAHAKDYLARYEWGRQLLEHGPPVRSALSGGPGDAASRVVDFFSTTFGLLGSLLVLLALTLYLAASPRTYASGLLLLVPPSRRGRGRQVLEVLGYHLRWWLIGRAVAMAAVAALTGVGLWLVGVPQFLVLALLAGLLTAIPFIGPITSAVPGLLLALMQGPTTALWAAGVYALAQAVENYLLTPLIQERTVNIPPALTIVGIALVGALFGVLGAVVATPLVLSAMVLVKMLYVEDALGDPLDVPGEGAATAPA
jgi:predicted PurR-regulated permease PerM